MQIKLTPAASSQLELIADIPSVETGFLLGRHIGKFIIIENLFPIAFNRENIRDIYGTIFSQPDMGPRLVGVFFNRVPPFHSDWFIEDVMIHIGHPQPGYFSYSFEKKWVQMPGITPEKNI